jgi:uracil-DNA glycosylase
LQNSLFNISGLGAKPHLQVSADATTAFVFSCPGQKEELLGHPCAGATGRNLDAALPKLRALAPQFFASSSRAAYVLTNSWSQIEYPAKTGRSEATATEILSPDNLNRLERELAGITTILICGQKAKHAVLELQAQGRLAKAKVSVVMHLSPLAVNSHAAWRGKSGDERLALWAQAAVSQLHI